MKLIKSLFAFASGLALVGLATGCSSVANGSRQTVSINSRPAGAEVLVYDSNCKVVYKKTTPCAPQLKRVTANGEAESYIVLVRKKGFAPVQVPLKAAVSGDYYSNVLLPGLGSMVDQTTGAKWTLRPGPAIGEQASRPAEILRQYDVLVSLTPRATEPKTALAEYIPNQE